MSVLATGGAGFKEFHALQRDGHRTSAPPLARPRGEALRASVDARRIRPQTGWRHEVSCAHGLARTVAWHAAHTEGLMRKKRVAEGFAALLRARHESMKR